MSLSAISLLTPHRPDAAHLIPVLLHTTLCSIWECLLCHQCCAAISRQCTPSPSQSLPRYFRLPSLSSVVVPPQDSMAYLSYSFSVQGRERTPRPTLRAAPLKHLGLRDRWATSLTGCYIATLPGPCAFARVVNWPEVVAPTEAVAGADEVVDKWVQAVAGGTHTGTGRMDMITAAVEVVSSEEDWWWAAVGQAV